MGVLRIAGVKIDNLTKTFPVAGRRLLVLDEFSAAFPERSISVLVGRSGCGKTTLLRVLAGFEPYDSGAITRPARDKIGMVFQEPRLMSWLSVWRNITFGVPRDRMDTPRIRELIATVGLTGFEGAYPAQLSGGMQQRAALARALAYDPDLILMDEPFAALDYFTREGMQKELLRVHALQRKSIIFVTHSIDEALLIGQRILVIGQGRVARQFLLDDHPYPRDILSPELIAVKKDIIATI